MNTPETINIEKYAEALNNLIGVDNAYFQGDKDVDAILELIVSAKKLENRVKGLEAEVRKMDAVAIVRCKDCKHYRDWGDCTTCMKWTVDWDVPTEPNAFCSYGELEVNNE